ncbi:MAG: serine/threonine protein kinase, partial [Isosphaeraceae bacterium]|nr:serine/threonine protein kinase [Isosphaeraceae bacterium]
SAPAADALGGTLDYMSPEHLEELADGVPGRVDARSDVYGLGVLLYEFLMGARPFAPPRDALSPTEVLLRAAEERRAGAPSLRETHPEVPVAFEAVIRRCLAPEADDRYPTAADLAADLQAVADDQPLRFAREPWPSRVVRWAWRHRRALAMAAPLLAAIALGVGALWIARSLRDQSKREVTQLITAGRRAEQTGDYAEAIDKFQAASRLADARPFLQPLHARARSDLKLAQERLAARASADALFHAGESIRFRLAGFAGNPAEAAHLLQSRLEPFYVLANRGWFRLSQPQLLDPETRARLLEDVDELLFLWALSLDRMHDPRAVALCDHALAFTTNPGPWRALRDRLAGTPRPLAGDDLQAETSSLACFEWGLLLEHEGRRPDALACLLRSIDLAEGNCWRRAYVALVAQQSGRSEEASRQAEAAVALHATSPWARLSRARIALSRGDRDAAVRDYQEALHAHAQNLDERDPAFERQVQRELDLQAR